MGEKIYRIAHIGAFDIESYGDVLFTRALRWALERRLPCQIDLYGAMNKEHLWGDNQKIYDINEEVRKEKCFYDAVIIGGGEFLHFRPIRFMGEKCIQAENLWEKPAKWSQESKKVYFFNCVGVPYDFSVPEQKRMSEVMSDASVIAVRDEFSEARLKRAVPNSVVNCIADNLWYLNLMYPKIDIGKIRKTVGEQLALNFDEDYLLLQYGTTKDIEKLAEQIRIIYKERKMRIYFLPINYCHEDKKSLQLLAAKLNQKVTLITAKLEPLEIAAIVSGASSFIGTSLHSCLTAASYGVPFIGIDMYPSFVSKMDGLFSMLGCEQYLVPTVQGTAAAMMARWEDQKVEQQLEEKILELQKRLDIYFDEVVDVIINSARREKL